MNAAEQYVKRLGLPPNLTEAHGQIIVKINGQDFAVPAPAQVTQTDLITPS